MLMLKHLKNKIWQSATEMRWSFAACALAGYLVITHIGFQLCNETALVASLTEFLYFIIVSMATVGYGDLSPVTQEGRLFVALFVIPFGIALFASLLGKITTEVILQCSKRFKGEHRLLEMNHIIIIGHNKTTGTLLQQVKQETQDRYPLVLCVDRTAPEKNPYIDLDVEYLRSHSISDASLYERACAHTASHVIIDIDNDGDTHLLCMHLAATSPPDCRITAYVRNDMVSNLLDNHPKITVIPSLRQQMLIKAAIDPGSEEVVRKLVDISTGQTQYSTHAPERLHDMRVQEVAARLRSHCRASIIAIKKADDPVPMLNPDYDMPISGGDEIYYIARQRITEDELDACFR